MLSENTKAKLEAYYKLKLNRIPFNPAMLQVTKRSLLQAGITEEEINLLEEYAKFPRDEQAAFVLRMKLKPIPFDIFLNGKYAMFQETMEKLEKEGKLKQWLVQYANNYLRPKELITIEDINSLKLIKESIPLIHLRTDYGNAYMRPFFLLTVKDFNQFYKKLSGQTEVAGCCLVVRQIEETYFTSGLRILIANDLKDTAYHEMRHSIDPYLHKRKREDRVLEEFISFFGVVVRPKTCMVTVTRIGPGNLKITEVKETKSKMGILYIRNALKLKAYHSQMCPYLSLDEYKAVVDNVANMLEGLSAYYSMEEIDRILYHCQTIDQLKRVYLVVSIQGKV